MKLCYCFVVLQVLQTHTSQPQLKLHQIRNCFKDEKLVNLCYLSVINSSPLIPVTQHTCGAFSSVRMGEHTTVINSFGADGDKST